MNARFVRRAERAALRASLLDICVLSLFSYAFIPVSGILSAVLLVLSIVITWHRHEYRLLCIYSRAVRGGRELSC